MPAVAFHGVGKRYPDGTVAVSDLDLAIADREYVCLLGPSGCGKSSTLRMLAGLETVSDGEIRLDGRRINELPPQQRDMAMVFENYALYPHLDVFHNIAMPLVARDRPAAEIARRVAAVAETLQLSALLRMYPYQLSGGQRQRVSVGRAIVRQPSMFLLDEPLGHLEAYLRVQLRAEIRRLHESLGATTVHITHDQEEAAAVSDRIAVMDGGRLQQVGSIVDLLDAPANLFVARFIGSPPINILPAELVDGRHGLGAGVAGAVVPLPADRWGWLRQAAVAGPLSLGIRPEHVDLDATGGATGLPVTVVELEPQGSEAVAIVDSAAGRLSVVVPSHRAPAPGTTAFVRPDGARAHLFDASGVSLAATNGR
ncbi:MAG: ABC transporter ATP-binding protein [Geminicoccaceae bacterium]